MRGQKPAGAILYQAGKGEAADVVYAVAKWRDSTGREGHRRLGELLDTIKAQTRAEFERARPGGRAAAA